MEENKITGIDKYAEAVQSNQRYNVQYPLYVMLDDLVIKLKPSEDVYQKFELEHKVCNAIYIDCIKSDIETRVKTCEIRYLNVSGKWETKECELDMLVDERSVVKLSKYGVDVTSSNAKDVTKHLANQLRMAKTMKQINKAGFVRMKRK